MINNQLFVYLSTRLASNARTPEEPQRYQKKQEDVRRGKNSQKKVARRDQRSQEDPREFKKEEIKSKKKKDIKMKKYNSHSISLFLLIPNSNIGLIGFINYTSIAYAIFTKIQQIYYN